MNGDDLCSNDWCTEEWELDRHLSSLHLSQKMVFRHHFDSTADAGAWNAPDDLTTRFMAFSDERGHIGPVRLDFVDAGYALDEANIRAFGEWFIARADDLARLNRELKQFAKHEVKQ